MRKKFKRIALSLFLSGALLASSAAKSFAGPQIDFGDNGYLTADIKLQFFSEYTNIGSGPNGLGSRNDMHFQRMRLTLQGMIDDTWGAQFQTCGNPTTTKSALGYMKDSSVNDPNDRSVKIIDAYIIGNFSDNLKMKLGLTKIPLTRENLIDCFAPLEMDRSMYVYTPYGNSAETFSRNFGVVFWGTFFEDHLKYWLAAMQGREGSANWSLNSPTNVTVPNQMGYMPSGVSGVTSPQPSNTNLMYIARVHYSFLDPEPGGSGYLGTYFGKKKILTIGVGAMLQPNAVYKNVNAPNYNSYSNSYTYGYVPAVYDPSTGKIIKPAQPAKNQLINDDTANMKAFAADLMFEYPFENIGTLTTTAQYLAVNFDNAYETNQNPADQSTYIAGLNGQKHGYLGQLAFMPDFKIGEEGRIQPYIGYQRWNFAKLLGITNQVIKEYSGGINYYIKGQNVRITAEYLRTDFDKETGMMSVAAPYTITGFNTFRMMFQLVF